MKIYLALYKGKKGGQSPKALALRLADLLAKAKNVAAVDAINPIYQV